MDETYFGNPGSLARLAAHPETRSPGRGLLSEAIDADWATPVPGAKFAAMAAATIAMTR